MTVVKDSLMNDVIDSGLWRARYVADLKDFGEGARRRQNPLEVVKTVCGA